MLNLDEIVAFLRWLVGLETPQQQRLYIPIEQEQPRHPRKRVYHEE